ncbi:MAG: hypothetical protein Q4G36_03920 [Paracoccus sp. (in: a-proteobacteria)]|nr:hypothetical protein [Paracoccus sp. (in: a-proteobacteria)]
MSRDYLQKGGAMPIARRALALWRVARLDLTFSAGRGMAEGLRGAGVPVRQVAP